ncbi:MAG TPA: hypothetical protein VFC82_04610 [Actinomycetaceae bacterium]|nr:hypothetical protein [Actinomycetaceae bacterium]
MSTVRWLLEDDNPSVRYFTLRDLLGRTDDDGDVEEARHAIMLRGAVPLLLGRQREAGYLAEYRRFYTAKYAGLVWSLIVLAELGAQRNDQIAEQCEYLFANAQELRDGGFAMNTAARTGGGRITEVIPCLTGNLVWALIRFGYIDDPRLLQAVDWLTTYMRFNDGVETEPQVQPYDRYEICWGAHTCFMGVVKALKGLGEIPAPRRTDAVEETIRRSVEFLLIHHVHKRSHDLEKVSKPGWKRFSFPLMYQTDVLEILDLLTGLGIADARMDEAVSLVRSKQGTDGRWRMDNTYTTDKLLIPFEAKGEPSKWITLRALRVLQRYAPVSA